MASSVITLIAAGAADQFAMAVVNGLVVFDAIASEATQLILAGGGLRMAIVQCRIHTLVDISARVHFDVVLAGGEGLLKAIVASTTIGASIGGRIAHMIAVRIATALGQVTIAQIHFRNFHLASHQINVGTNHTVRCWFTAIRIAIIWFATCVGKSTRCFRFFGAVLQADRLQRLSQRIRRLIGLHEQFSRKHRMHTLVLNIDLSVVLFKFAEHNSLQQFRVDQVVHAPFDRAGNL